RGGDGAGAIGGSAREVGAARDRSLSLRPRQLLRGARGAATPLPRPEYPGRNAAESPAGVRAALQGAGRGLERQGSGDAADGIARRAARGLRGDAVLI